VTVLAYGRQPWPLLDRLSHALNLPGSPYFVFHTAYMAAGSVWDYHAHRRRFWALSERAVFSLAYSATETDRKHRFPFPFVGQRWFEAIAAGCVVAGRRPAGEETDELLDWPDATLELDPEPEAAVAQLCDWLGDGERLRAIGLRNAAMARARHDWRHRLDLMEPAIREILGRRGGAPTPRPAPQGVAAPFERIAG
jgi:hypothetical protein